jgi:hypothetical protein
MSRLSMVGQARVVASLVEGNSIRATVRITGTAKNTIVKLLRELGAACSRFQDETIRNIRSKRVQCDEIWSFTNSKEKNTTQEKKAVGCGDCWTWTGMDAESKLMISWRLGARDGTTAHDSSRISPADSRTVSSSQQTATSRIWWPWRMRSAATSTIRCW